jgi:Isocitrate/isopropylmalate dehydrogenase
MRVMVLPCDGIGPEITAATMRVLEATDAGFELGLSFDYEDAGFASLEKHGTTLRQETIERARGCNGVILGPQSHMDYPARVDRAGEAETAGELAGKIGEDVGVEVRCHDHVIARRVAHEMRRHSVDDDVIEPHLEELLPDLAHPLKKEAVGDDEVVRLMHRRHVPAPLHRQPEGLPSDPIAGVDRDLPDRERDIGRRHELAESLVHVAIGVETLRRLAHDDQVHLLGPGLEERPRARRPDVGVEVEQNALAANGLPSVRTDVEAGLNIDTLNERVGGELRPIKVDKSLLEYMDPMKRVEFLRQWGEATKG